MQMHSRTGAVPCTWRAFEPSVVVGGGRVQRRQLHVSEVSIYYILFYLTSRFVIGSVNLTNDLT